MLHEVLRLLVAQYPDHLSGTTLVVDVDNTTMFHDFRKGPAGDERMHDLIKSLFRLQVNSDFTFKLKWACSADNKDADDLTRPGAVEHARLEQRCVGRLWEEWGGFDMDLRATGTSVQCIPDVGRDTDRALSFYSRYYPADTAGVDVLDQDVSHTPGSANACFSLCFPLPQMVTVVLQNMQGCKVRAVVVIPGDRQSWFPPLAATTVRSVPVAAKEGAGHRPLATPDMHHPAGGAVLAVQPVCWPMNAHFRADTGSCSGSARPRAMPRMPWRKRPHVSLLPMVRHAKYMLYDQR